MPMILIGRSAHGTAEQASNAKDRGSGIQYSQRIRVRSSIVENGEECFARTLERSSLLRRDVLVLGTDSTTIGEPGKLAGGPRSIIESLVLAILAIPDRIVRRDGRWKTVKFSLRNVAPSKHRTGIFKRPIYRSIDRLGSISNRRFLAESSLVTIRSANGPLLLRLSLSYVAASVRRVNLRVAARKSIVHMFPVGASKSGLGHSVSFASFRRGEIRPRCFYR